MADDFRIQAVTEPNESLTNKNGRDDKSDIEARLPSGISSLPGAPVLHRSESPHIPRGLQSMHSTNLAPIPGVLKTRPSKGVLGEDNIEVGKVGGKTNHHVSIMPTAGKDLKPAVLKPKCVTIPENSEFGGKMTLQELRKQVQVRVNHYSTNATVQTDTSLSLLKVGSRLFASANGRGGLDKTSVTYLPAALRRNVVFVQSQIDDHLIPSSDVMATCKLEENVYARAFILWPNNNDHIPSWVRADYQMLEPLGSASFSHQALGNAQDDDGESADLGDAAHEDRLGQAGAVQCRWHSHPVAGMVLWLLNKKHDFQNQTLLVYRSIDIIKPGSTFYTLGSNSLGETTDCPYILALQLAPTEFELQESNIPGTPFSPGQHLGRSVPAGNPVVQDLIQRASAVSKSDASSDGYNTEHQAFSSYGSALNPAVLRMLGKLAKSHDLQEGYETLDRLSANKRGVRVAAAASELKIHMRNMMTRSETSTAYQYGNSTYGDDGKLDFSDIPRIALVAAKGNLETVKVLLYANFLSGYLGQRKTYEAFERLAITRQDTEFMLILQYKAHQELSIGGLAFLVNAMWTTARRMVPCGLWLPAAQQQAADTAHMNNKTQGVARTRTLRPNGVPLVSNGGGDVSQDNQLTLADEIQAFLLTYVVKQRNPLSTTAAILRALQSELEDSEECRAYMEVVCARFQSLHYALLKQLQRRYQHVSRTLDQLEAILDPIHAMHGIGDGDDDLQGAKRYTINDTSPMQVAMDSEDLSFMSSPLVMDYNRATWLGSAFTAQTQCNNPRSSSLLSPLVAFKLMKEMGFTGGPANALLKSSAICWHLHALTSTSFFNSPRGRWVMHAACELAYLTMFQLVILYPDAAFTRPLLITFLVMVIGNIVEICEHVSYKYGTYYKLKRYVTDPWNALNLFTNLALTALVTLMILRDIQVPGEGLQDGYVQGDALQLAACTMAAPVWVRCLSFIIPAFPKLGPLLATVAKMLSEIVAFVIPMFVVVAGFATMLVGVYSERVASYATFPQGLLTMFTSMLGGWNYEFTEDKDGEPLPLEQQLYGTIVLSVYLIVAAILMMNLLIAIITNKYRPEELAAEMSLRRARLVDFYSSQVRQNRVCSPFNIVQAVLFWLPSPDRNRSAMTDSTYKYGLLPLEGPDAPSHRADIMKAGRAEIPYLMFLLTVYPVLMVYSNVTFYLFAPFAVMNYSYKTFRRSYRTFNSFVKSVKQQVKNKVTPDVGSAPSVVQQGASPKTAPSATTISQRPSLLPASKFGEAKTPSAHPPVTAGVLKQVKLGADQIGGAVAEAVEGEHDEVSDRVQHLTSNAHASSKVVLDKDRVGLRDAAQLLSPTQVRRRSGSNDNMMLPRCEHRTTDHDQDVLTDYAIPHSTDVQYYGRDIQCGATSGRPYQSEDDSTNHLCCNQQQQQQAVCEGVDASGDGSASQHQSPFYDQHADDRPSMPDDGNSDLKRGLAGDDNNKHFGGREGPLRAVSIISEPSRLYDDRSSPTALQQPVRFAIGVKAETARTRNDGYAEGGVLSAGQVPMTHEGMLSFKTDVPDRPSQATSQGMPTLSAKGKLLKSMAQILEESSHHLPTKKREYANTRLQRLERSLMGQKKPGKAIEASVLFTVTYWLSNWALMIAGIFIYVIMLGLVLLTLWSSLYLWVAKIVFSLYNICCIPAGYALFRQRSSRSTPSMTSSGPAVAQSKLAVAEPGSAAAAQQQAGHGLNAAKLKWRNALAKVVEAHIIHKPEYLEHRDIIQALNSSRFTRAVNRWGLMPSLIDGHSDQSLGSSMKDTAERSARGEDYEEDDDDDDDDGDEGGQKVQEVTDMVAKVNEDHTDLVNSVEQVKYMMQNIMTMLEKLQESVGIDQSVHESVAKTDDTESTAYGYSAPMQQQQGVMRTNPVFGGSGRGLESPVTPSHINIPQ